MSSFSANCDVNALAGKFNPHSVSLMPYICSFSFLWQWQWVRRKDVKKYIYSQLSFPVLELLVRCMPSHAYSTADTPIQPAPHPASTNHTSPSSRFIPIAPSLLPTLSIPPFTSSLQLFYLLLLLPRYSHSSHSPDKCKCEGEPS